MGVSVLQAITGVFRPLPGIQTLAFNAGARLISKKCSSLCAKMQINEPVPRNLEK